jgi:hypothetical protein
MLVRAVIGFHALSVQPLTSCYGPKTTKLYDRTGNTISLDEIQRIVI